MGILEGPPLGAPSFLRKTKNNHINLYYRNNITVVVADLQRVQHNLGDHTVLIGYHSQHTNRLLQHQAVKEVGLHAFRDTARPACKGKSA
jgi:hypothetical protein